MKSEIGTPVIRGIRALLTYARLLQDPIGSMHRLFETHGPLVVIGKSNRLSRREELKVLAYGHDFNRTILSNPNVFRSRGMGVKGPEGSAQQRIRIGLITTNADQHDAHRKLVKPPFLKPSVDRYRDQMVELTDLMLERWHDSEHRDISNDMRNLSLWITGAILFGHDDRDEVNRIGELLQEWLYWCFSPRVILFPVDVPGTPYRKLLAHAELLEAAICGMIHRRRSAGRLGCDVMSILIQASDQQHTPVVADSVLAGQTTILFGAAHETMTNALTWTLFLLSQHPRVMADLLDELDGELGGDPPQTDQFDRLPLLDRVIKESLRLLPPVSWGTRIVDQPTRLGDLELPKGTRVYFSQYMTHRTPDLYPNPQRFEPDRWKGPEPPAFSYLPFGAGPRMCIGYVFSITMMKTCLGMMLQRFRLSLVPGTRIDRKMSLTLSSRYGMPMTVHKQDRRFVQCLPTGNIHEMVDLHSQEPVRSRASGAKRAAVLLEPQIMPRQSRALEAEPHVERTEAADRPPVVGGGLHEG